MFKKITALTSTLGLLFVALMFGAAPAQASGNDGTWSLSNDTTGPGSLGYSTLNGGTSSLGNRSVQLFLGAPSGASLRAFKTSPGYCIDETSTYYDGNGNLRNGERYLHRYTTANGGYSTVRGARLTLDGSDNGAPVKTLKVRAFIIKC